MANEFLKTKVIARNALPRLIENLVMPNLCYKDYSNTFGHQGETIRVKKPVILEAKEFVAGTPVQEQDIKEDSVDVTLDKIATVDVSIEAIEMATDLEDLNATVITPAAVALAEKINADGLDMYKYFNASAGTAGVTPNSLGDFAAARKTLNAAKVPMSNRVGIWDVNADANFTQIGNLVKVNEAGTARALREGEIGRVFGIDNYMAQGVKHHTTGAAGTVAVDHTGSYPIGTTEIHVDGLSSAFVVGDRFTLNGDQYVVVDVKALAGGDQDITIYPGLKKAAANDAAITVVGSYAANMVFHKNAIAFVTRPLVAPTDKDAYTTSLNGISMRVVRGYDMSYKREKISIDVLYGYKTVYPEMGLTYLG